MSIYTAEALHAFCAAVLEGAGMQSRDAAAVADCLVDAELSGVASHGVSRMGIYLNRLEAGVVNPRGVVTVLRDAPSALSLDGGNAMGAVAGTEGMKRCIVKAQQTGCCWTTVRASNHYGAAGYYARMAADAGMIGISMTNLTAKIAPHGSRQGYMGTNPIAFAAPSLGDPVVLDMTPSVVALGKLILAQKLGKSIPEGWALDREGRPTTDPAEGRKGTLVPIGGPKGSGLAIFVDIFCGILGAGAFGPHLNDLYGDMENPQGVCHAFCAIDISKFLDVEDFKAAVSQMAGEIKGLPTAAGVEEILMPGERSARSRAARAEQGIPVPEAVEAELKQLGEKYRVAFPAAMG